MVFPLDFQPMQDVIIIGSGLVGAAAAIALADAGLRVALVDADSTGARLDAGYDGRTAAIAYGSRCVLEAVGVWPLIEQAEPIYDIRVCDQDRAAHVHYHYRDAGEEPFGHIIENRHLRVALYHRLEACKGVQLHAPATVQSLEQHAAYVEVQLSNGLSLRAPLLLAADGKNSATRRMLHINAKENAYGQTAIVCTIAHSQPHHGLAVERFLPAGPFALLPMSDNRTNIVWTESDALAKRMLELSEDELLQEITQRAGDHLGDISLAGPRFAYPLKLIRAESCIAPRVALIGDAAHAIHPIAGQGVNLGYRDVAVIAELIIERARLGLDIGSDALLSRYAGWRRVDVGSMAAATHGLNRLFSNNVLPLRLARDAGLSMVNELLPLKQFFMRHAMGMVGDLPKMMRKEAI